MSKFTKEMLDCLMFRVNEDRMFFDTDSISFEEAHEALQKELDAGQADGDTIDTVYACALKAAFEELKRLRPDLVEA